MMDTMSGGPPIVAYEKMVTPIVVVQKNAALNERDKHSQWKDRGSGRRRRRRISCLNHFLANYSTIQREGKDNTIWIRSHEDGNEESFPSFYLTKYTKVLQ